MSKDAQINFCSLCAPTSPSKVCAESTLEPRDRTFDLRALAVLSRVKSAIHLASIFGFRPTSSAAAIQVNDRAPNPQDFARIDVIAFRVVSGIRKNSIDASTVDCSFQNFRQERRILAGAIRNQHMDQEMRCV